MQVTYLVEGPVIGLMEGRVTVLVEEQVNGLLEGRVTDLGDSFFIAVCVPNYIANGSP